jgi:hypothetical protein
MESMRSTWTDSRLDDFAANTDKRFDAVDRRFDTVDRRFDKVDEDLREIRTGIGALQRTIIGVGGALIAAVMGVIATQL